MTAAQIDVAQLSSLADALVVDVREPDEYATGHVPGARNIPLGSIGDAAADLRQAENVYVICQSGRRSAFGCEQLSALGVPATNVAGGTSAWMAAGLPVEA